MNKKSTSDMACLVLALLITASYFNSDMNTIFHTEPSFGNDLRELRIEKEYSIKQLAIKLVITKTQLKRIELNKEFPSEGLLSRILHILNAETYNLENTTRLRKKIRQAQIAPYRPKADIGNLTGL